MEQTRYLFVEDYLGLACYIYLKNIHNKTTFFVYSKNTEAYKTDYLCYNNMLLSIFQLTNTINNCITIKGQMYFFCNKCNNARVRI
jgi:hypothetical protein